MHKRGLCYHAVSVHLSAIMLCLSVCLSLSSIVSKRVNVSSKFFLPSASHHSSFLIPDVMAVFRWGRPLTRAKIVIFYFGIDDCWSIKCRQYFDHEVKL